MGFTVRKEDTITQLEKLTIALGIKTKTGVIVAPAKRDKENGY